jgi:hypothetical protein
MSDDTSDVGRELLQEKDFSAVCEAKARISEEKCLLGECIVKSVGEQQSHKCQMCKAFKCHGFLTIECALQHKVVTSNKLTF